MRLSIYILTNLIIIEDLTADASGSETRPTRLQCPRHNEKAKIRHDSLHFEFNRLFSTRFDNPDSHVSRIESRRSLEKSRTDI